MINVSFTVYKNGYRSGDPVDTIESIETERLADHPKWSSLCKCGARQNVHEEGTFYKEYDAYYFQADDIVDAMEKGLRHYRENDLRTIDGEYSMYLYKNGYITMNELFSLRGKAAYEKYKEYLNRHK